MFLKRTLPSLVVDALSGLPEVVFELAFVPETSTLATSPIVNVLFVSLQLLPLFKGFLQKPLFVVEENCVIEEHLRDGGEALQIPRPQLLSLEDVARLTLLEMAAFLRESRVVLESA